MCFIYSGKVAFCRVSRQKAPSVTTVSVQWFHTPAPHEEMAFNGVATIGMPQPQVNPNSCNQSALISVNTMPSVNNPGPTPTVVLLSTPSPQHQQQQQQQQVQQQNPNNNNNNNGNMTTVGNNTMIVDGPHNNKRLCTRMDNNNDSGHINQNNTVSTITTTTPTTLTTNTTLLQHPPSSSPLHSHHEYDHHPIHHSQSHPPPQALTSSPSKPSACLVNSHSISTSSCRSSTITTFDSFSNGSRSECDAEYGHTTASASAPVLVRVSLKRRLQSSRNNYYNHPPQHALSHSNNPLGSVICDCLPTHHRQHANPTSPPTRDDDYGQSQESFLIYAEHAHPHHHPHNNNDHDYTRYTDGDYTNVIKCCSPSSGDASPTSALTATTSLQLTTTSTPLYTAPLQQQQHLSLGGQSPPPSAALLVVAQSSKTSSASSSTCTSTPSTTPHQHHQRVALASQVSTTCQ